MGTKKLFMFLIMGIFLFSMIGVVSAVQKDYDANTKTVKIKDTFLFIPIGDRATIQLLTPLTNYVPDGDEVLVIEYNITGYKDLDELFYGETKTYNKKKFELSFTVLVFAS